MRVRTSWCFIGHSYHYGWSTYRVFSSHDFFDDTFLTTVKWCTADGVFFFYWLPLLALSTLTVYAKGLPEGATAARYLEKIRVISVDSFILFSGGNVTDITRASLPPVYSSDIVSYLVLQTSFITTKQFKAAYK